MVTASVRARDGGRGLRRLLLGVLFLGLVGLMMRVSWSALNHQVADLGDPVLYGWTWSWTRHALFSNPVHLFDGNIFAPHRRSVAYSDNMLVVLLPFSLLRAAGANWALQLNLLSLGMLTLSLAATYSLTRRIVGHTDTAIFAAIAYTFGSFTFVHQGHLQLLLLGMFPLGFLSAFRWFETQQWRDAMWFGLLNASFFLGALYYSAVWMVCVAVVLLTYIAARRRQLDTTFWKGLLIVAVFSATAIPFIVPYLEVGVTRPLVREWGLQPRDLVTVAVGSDAYPRIDRWANGSVDRGEHSFFPGFSSELLAGFGFGALILTRPSRRRRATPPVRNALPPERRLELWLLAAAGGAAFVLALGPEVRGVTLPFTFFHDHVLGFKGIRVAARLAIPGLLAVCVFASVGLTMITARLSRRVGVAVAVVASAVLVVELLAPVSRVTLPTDAATLAVYRELGRRGPGTVAELPVADPHDAAGWARIEAPRMLYGSLDLHPRVNGYSGSWPRDYRRHGQILNTYPAPAAVALGARLHVRFLILHVGTAAGFAQYEPAQVRTIVAGLPGGTAHRYGNAWLVDLGPESSGD